MAARGKDRGSARGSRRNFLAFERSRCATGSLTTSPALSRIATIEFILVQRYLADQFLDAAPVICLIVLLVTNGGPLLMSTIELVDPELRDALAQQLPPLTAESLTQRRANALELAEAGPETRLRSIQ